MLPYKDVWRLSAAALDLLGVSGRGLDELQHRGLITYRRPTAGKAVEIAGRWLAEHDRITTGDYVTLTGRTQPAALQALDRMVREGFLARGEAMGRNAHYVKR